MAATDRISISRVAREAGVSIATVSRVVNGIASKARPETVAKVRKAVADLGYRPASAGQALRSRQSRLVALLAANLANPAMTAIAASAEVALREAGLVMVLCDTHDRADLQDEYLLEMRAHQVRATILLGAVESPGLVSALESGETLLFVGRSCPIGPTQPFIGIDNARAGADVAAFVVARGCRRPVLIHGPLTSSATSDRVTALLAGLAARRGRALDPSRVAGGTGLDHLVIGYEAMARLSAATKGRLDAVACTSDLIALGARRWASENGLDVASILFVGFDDNPLNPWVAPWLSSVWIPYDRFGGAILESLKAIWSDRHAAPIILDHEMHARFPPERR